MKKILRLLFAGLMTLVLQNCTEDENSPDLAQNVQFTFNLPSEDNSEGKVSGQTLPEGTSLLVSIETNTGEPVHTRKKIQLLKIGTNYISEPLPLVPGRYNVTEFMLVDESMEILFATPLKGSPLSKAVNHPLPHSFIVAKSKLATIDMEVVSTSLHTPEDFGYASFNLNIVYPFQVSVFIPKNDKLELTSAEVFILKERDTVQTYSLGSKVNTVPFNQDPEEEFTLVIIKDAYSRYARDFTFNTLQAELGQKPLQVTLQPALTMVGVAAGSNNNFSFQLDAAWYYDYFIDWGDGTQEVWPSGFITFVEHDYAQAGKYFVSVTGRIDQIILTGSFFQDIERINLDHLTNLDEFRMEQLPKGPKIIDLSHNKELTNVYISNTKAEEIIIPNDIAPFPLEIPGNTELTVESLDNIISALYQMTEIHGTGRWFYFYKWDEEHGYHAMVTPSPEAIEKLRALKDHWEIVPDPDLFP